MHMHQLTPASPRAQELSESGGGRPALPLPNTSYSPDVNQLQPHALGELCPWCSLASLCTACKADHVERESESDGSYGRGGGGGVQRWRAGRGEGGSGSRGRLRDPPEDLWPAIKIASYSRHK